MKTSNTTKSSVNDKEDFLSAFFGADTKNVVKEINTNDDLDFITKGLDESQKKSEKQRSIFDGVGNENILNSTTKANTFVTKQKNSTKSPSLVLDKPSDKSPINNFNFSKKLAHQLISQIPIRAKNTMIKY